MNKKIIITFIINMLIHSYVFADNSVAAQCQTNGVDFHLAKQWVEDLQKGLKTNDKNKVADLALYPVEIKSTASNNKVNTITINNKKAFIAQYDQIFSEPLKKLLIAQDTNNIFCNWQGAMIANGALWFRSDEQKQGFFVINSLD